MSNEKPDSYEYNNVYYTPFYNPNKGGDRPITYINDPFKIKEQLAKYGCEFVGCNNKVKPYFDVDFKVPFETTKDDILKIQDKKDNECLNLINEWFSEYDISIKKSFKNFRKCSDKDEVYYKISLRYFVNGVVMKNFNILKFLNTKNINFETHHNKPFDLGIYNEGRILLLPYTFKPKCAKDSTETVLYPVKNNTVFNIFDYCATYIDKNDIDLDVLFNETTINNNFININDNITNNDKIHKEFMERLTDFVYINDNTDEIMGLVKKYVKSFTKEVADDYNTWVKVAHALKCIGEKYDRKEKCLKLFKFFSSKSKKYKEAEAVNLFNIIKLKKKSIGLPTLKRMYEYYVKGASYFEKYSYSNVKKDFESVICKVLKGSFFIYKDPYGDFQYLNKEKLLINYQNTKCYIKDDDGEFKCVPFIKKWLDDENIRTYNKVECNPLRTINGVFNIWCGFKADAIIPVNDNDIDYLIKPIIHHLEEVITGTNDLWFILSWLANIIQKPYEKSNVAILIRGLQGTGKDIILVWFMNNVLGLKCSSQNASLSELFDRFDNICANNVFSIIDEVNIKDLVGEKSGNAEKLKNLITSETIRFEEKGVMKTTLNNYINIIMTSNNDNPIIIPHDDRRFVVFDTKATYKGNTTYFKSLGEHLKRDDVARAFYQYLLKFDISNIHNFQDVRPITSYYNELKRMNLPVFYRYLSYLCENTHLFNNDYNEDEIYSVNASSLYSKFVDWIKSRNYTYTSNATLFGRDLKKISDVDANIINKNKDNGVIKYLINLKRLKVYLISISLYDCEIV